MIELENVSFSYDGRHPILEPTNLSILRGEFIGIIGPNGGGKTTLLKLLMGFLAPDRGKVRIFGGPPHDARGRIGYVPQIHRTDRDFPISVGELVLLGRMDRWPLMGRWSRKDWERCDDILEQLGLLAHKKKAYGDLSGGLAQRALLARALISDPELLLLDEPMSNIDAQSMILFLKTLEHLKGKKTILFVTHDLKTIAQRVDRLLCVQGRLTAYKPQEICEHFALGIYHSPLEAAEMQRPR